MPPKGINMKSVRAPSSAAIRADPDRLAQVVTILLSNALKFSPAQDEVVVAIEEATGVVRISVREHSGGISVDFKPHIFARDSRRTMQRTHGKTVAPALA